MYIFSLFIFEILLVKIFSLKQKTKQILPANVEEIKLYFFKKTVPCSFMFLLLSCKHWNKQAGIPKDKRLQ